MDYEPLQLNTAPLLEAFWGRIEPMFTRCAERAVHGEWAIDDLRELVGTGKIVVFVITNDRTGMHPDCDVRLALAVEPVFYPRLPVLNILALGGSGTREYFRRFWKQFTGWAFISGFKAIDGWTSPGMARMTGSLGFKPVYTVMRYDLTGASDG